MISIRCAAIIISAIGASVMMVGCIAGGIAHQERAKQTSNPWVVLPVPLGGKYCRDVQFLDSNRGWLITDHDVWKTTDAGDNWELAREAPTVALLKRYEPQEDFQKVQFLDERVGWILEGDYLISTTDGGVTWRKHELKNVIARSFNFLDKQNGWVAGQLLRLPDANTSFESFHPVVYITKDGGRLWECAFEGLESPYPFWDVYAISSANVWAVGALIVNSMDGSRTWTKMSINFRDGITGIPAEVSFVDGNIGWILTNESKGYFFTRDAGKTWEPRLTPADMKQLADVVYIGPVEVWAAGTGIYHSDDSGSSWTKELEGDFSRIVYSGGSKSLFATGRSGLVKRRVP